VPPESKPNVLIAEDEPDQRTVLEMQFQRAGLDVRTAGDGEEAMIEYWKAAHAGQCFDLIILDMAMPRMDGKTVASRIRLAESESKYLKRARIIGYTGYDSFVTALLSEEDMKLFDEMLYKPVMPEKFDALAASLIARK
jgi:CheY-like chemotaxis protein